jgi:signal transduction histidine kinase
LINLVDNAVKHSPPGGQVVVGLDGAETGLSLWVEDHGPGIPPEEHGRISSAFTGAARNCGAKLKASASV